MHLFRLLRNIRRHRYAAPAVMAFVLIFACGTTQARPLAPAEPAMSSLMVKIESSQDETAKGARNFVSNMAARAIEFLGDESLSQERKKEAFRELLNNSFDMKTIGRFALGRYWRMATPSQKEEYFGLFQKMVVEVYSQRFSEYKGQKFRTEGVRHAGNDDYIVTSYILPPDGQGQKVQVDWRVRYKDGRYQIIDVIVEGVSMVVTQRSDFSSVIQRGGGNVAILIDHLEEKVGKKS